MPSELRVPAPIRTPPESDLDRIGIVVIGRNEGSRLAESLASIGGLRRAVYVDSASTDGSPDLARGLGIEVIGVEAAPPFTAARARDAGLRRLLSLSPALEYVMFLDGDCTLAEGWLARAVAELDEDPGVAVVCGRRRERDAGRSAFRRLMDLEWDTPVGEALACGGDAVFRVRPYLDGGGYNATLPAGEEPELCHRLRARGGRILRVDAEMTVHDMGDASFGPWWLRNVRHGYAAVNMARRFPGPDAPYRRQIASAWAWGVAVPCAVLGAAWLGPPIIGASSTTCGLLAALVYPLQALRLAASVRHRSPDAPSALAYGMANLTAKWAHLIGQAAYLKDLIAGRSPRLIEYRTSRRGVGRSS